MVSRCNTANKCVLDNFSAQASYFVCDLLTNSLRWYISGLLIINCGIVVLCNQWYLTSGS